MRGGSHVWGRRIAWAFTDSRLLLPCFGTRRRGVPMSAPSRSLGNLTAANPSNSNTSATCPSRTVSATPGSSPLPTSQLPSRSFPKERGRFPNALPSAELTSSAKRAPETQAVGAASTIVDNRGAIHEMGGPRDPSVGSAYCSFASKLAVAGSNTSCVRENVPSTATARPRRPKGSIASPIRRTPSSRAATSNNADRISCGASP
jgi:hypothetical protein